MSSYGTILADLRKRVLGFIETQASKPQSEWKPAVLPCLRAQPLIRTGLRSA